jgi:putative addiction module killer protein
VLFVLFVLQYRIYANTIRVMANIRIIETETFSRWFKKFNDLTAKTNILTRFDRVKLGHLGEVDSVGGGVFEMKFHCGAGYRVYFSRRSNGEIILLLGGGDKTSQDDDIKHAKKLNKKEFQELVSK